MKHVTQPLEPNTGHQDKTLFEGIARGGPLNGQTVQSRYPEGILAVDKVSGRCWVYDRVDNDWNDEFQVREEGGREVDFDKRWATADEPRFEVQAVVTE